jgi:hypothetical protein
MQHQQVLSLARGVVVAAKVRQTGKQTDAQIAQSALETCIDIAMALTLALLSH